MAKVLLPYKETYNTQNARIKYITPCEKTIIQNVFGHHPEIPQTIFNRIQEKLDSGLTANAILKIKLPDGTSHWVKNSFKPKNIPTGKFNVSTELLNKKEIKTTSTLYGKLNRIEHFVNVRQAEKFLQGYLEEEKLDFNDLTKI